jgi:hypothetical protein
VDTYAQKTALRLGISPEAVRLEFAKGAQRPAYARTPDSEEPEETSESEILEVPSPQEFWLLKLLLVHDELAAWAASRLDPNWISNTPGRQIIERRLNAHKNGTWRNLAAFLDESDSDAMRSLITEAATQERAIPNPETQLADVILKLRNQYLDRQIAALTQRTAAPELSDAQKIEFLQAQKKLREQKASPLAERRD